MNVVVNKSLPKIELECPQNTRPQVYAKAWVTKNNGHDEFSLVKVSKLKATNRAHTHFAEVSYFYLFVGQKLLLSNVAGLDLFFKYDKFDPVVLFARQKVGHWHWTFECYDRVPLEFRDEFKIKKLKQAKKNIVTSEKRLQRILDVYALLGGVLQ